MDGQIHAQSSHIGFDHSSGPVVVESPQGGPGWHDQVYRAAAGELVKVPWAEGKPNPALISWLNAEAAARVRPGSRAVVVGCGLGDDVVELLNRGYDAIGFDVSPAAIDWARKRFAPHSNAFCVADLFNAPTRFRHRFELVVESYTLQSIDPSQREAAGTAIASLLGPRGVLVAVARGRDEAELLEQVQGPPWPLTRLELAALMEANGLKPSRAIDDFADDQTPPQRRLRGVFEHA
jgi:hypothetical protein